MHLQYKLNIYDFIGLYLRIKKKNMKQTISDRLTDQLKLGLPEAGIHRDPEVVGAEGRSGQ